MTFEKNWIWLCTVYLEMAAHDYPTKYHSRIDGLLFPCDTVYHNPFNELLEKEDETCF